MDISRLILTIIVLSGVVTGCKELPWESLSKKKVESSQADASVAPKGFLTSQDLQPPNNITELPLQEMRENLNNSSFFVNVFSGDFADKSENSEESCIQRQINTTKIQATKTSLKLDVRVDLSNCPANDGAVRSIKLDMRILFHIVCDNADFRSWNGKSSNEVKGDLSCNGQGYYLKNVKSNMVDNYTDPNSNQTIMLNVSGVDGTMTRNGEGCKFSTVGNIRSIDNACLDFNSSIREYAGSRKVNFLLAEYDNVKSDLATNSKYFSAGQMKVTLNNWQGTVSYRGATLTPTYQLSSSKGQTDAGQITNK